MFGVEAAEEVAGGIIVLAWARRFGCARLVMMLVVMLLAVGGRCRFGWKRGKLPLRTYRAESKGSADAILTVLSGSVVVMLSMFVCLLGEDRNGGATDVLVDWAMRWRQVLVVLVLG